MSNNSQHNFALSINEQAINNANIVLRTLLLINSGAAVALLAFVGNIVNSETVGQGKSIVDLTLPLLWFGWGVVAAVFAMAFAYFTNYMVVGHTFAIEANDQKRIRCLGAAKPFFHAIAIILALASINFFVCGLFKVRDAIISLY